MVWFARIRRKAWATAEGRTAPLPFRIAACLVLASSIAAGQPRIERGPTNRVPRGLISPVVAENDTGGTIIPVNGRRTTLVRIDSARDAYGRGFTAAELAALGIFAPSGAVANAIVGHARDAAASLLADAPLQLRNLTLGGVVSHARTNTGGQFAFPSLPTGTYIVELLAPQGQVVALSDAVSVASGDVVQTVVQMSSPSKSFTGWIGGATTSAVNSAVEAGVLAIQAPASASPES
jgi:hypothetical protein